ncbi:MAG: peptidyl-prolyl cis-trans isomerase [candidate division WOR-3 bacterium]
MKHFTLILTFLTITLITGCQKSPSGLRAPQGKVIGTVNQDRITVPEVNYAAEQLRVEVTAANLPKILDRMVAVNLLAQEAIRRGFLKDEKVISGLAWNERLYLASELTSRIAETAEPTSGEILEYFQKHRDDFGLGLKMMLMVIADSVIAEQTRSELLAGADFAKLARERSLDTSYITVPGYPTRGVGMSFGWGLADEEAVFNLKPGEISPVIPTLVGYQIVKVLEKRVLTDNPALNQATQYYIGEALKEQRRRQVMDSLLTSLKEKAKVVLSPEEYTR